MLVGMSRASRLIGKDSANRPDIFFRIVLQGEILLLDGIADHDQSAAGVQAEGQQRCDRHSHWCYTSTALDPLIFHFSLTGCVVHLRVTPDRAAFPPTYPVAFFHPPNPPIASQSISRDATFTKRPLHKHYLLIVAPRLLDPLLGQGLFDLLLRAWTSTAFLTIR